MTTPPRPALDPELAAALTLLCDEITPSITPDMIPALRQRRARLLPTDTTFVGRRGSDITGRTRE
ncbi:hypothetical protein HGB44_30980, partial [Nocardiopsis dassonvillei subsp. albirubida]|nr:hypothetical protein [Nocardiopsis alborubida]